MTALSQATIYAIFFLALITPGDSIINCASTFKAICSAAVLALASVIRTTIHTPSPIATRASENQGTVLTKVFKTRTTLFKRTAPLTLDRAAFAALVNRNAIYAEVFFA